MTGEPRYTLAEARQKLAEVECSWMGHDYNVIANLAVGPLRVRCSRCGEAWVTVRPDA